MNNATNKSNKKSGIGGTEFGKPTKFGKEDIMKMFSQLIGADTDFDMSSIARKTTEGESL